MGLCLSAVPPALAAFTSLHLTLGLYREAGHAGQLMIEADRPRPSSMGEGMACRLDGTSRTSRWRSAT